MVTRSSSDRRPRIGAAVPPFDGGAGEPCEWCGSRAVEHERFGKFHWAIPLNMRNEMLLYLVEAYLASEYAAPDLERLEQFMRHRWKLDRESERVRRRYFARERTLLVKGMSPDDARKVLRDLEVQVSDTSRSPALFALEDAFSIYDDEYCLHCEGAIPGAVLARARQLGLDRPPHCSFACMKHSARALRRSTEWATFEDPYLWIFVEPVERERRDKCAVELELPIETGLCSKTANP